MSEATRRILLACLTLLVAACLCLSLISLTGVIWLIR